MSDAATDTYRQEAPRRVVSVSSLGNGSRDAEIPVSFRHFADLDVQSIGVQKCGVDVPARTRARMSGNTNSGKGKSFRDISGYVCPDKMKWHPGEPWPLKC